MTQYKQSILLQFRNTIFVFVPNMLHIVIFPHHTFTIMPKWVFCNVCITSAYVIGFFSRSLVYVPYINMCNLCLQYNRRKRIFFLLLPISLNHTTDCKKIALFFQVSNLFGNSKNDANSELLEY